MEATGLPPTNDLESAIVQTLAPGAYTAILRGKGNTAGIGVMEAYDLNQTANSKFGNIATRGFVDTGDNVMIGGLIVGPVGGTSTKVLVRAIGPSLTNFGIAGALPDPTLELHDGNGVTIASNDDWKIRPDGSSQQAEIEVLEEMKELGGVTIAVCNKSNQKIRAASDLVLELNLPENELALLAPYISLWHKTNFALAQPELDGVQLTHAADLRFLKNVSRRSAVARLPAN